MVSLEHFRFSFKTSLQNVTFRRKDKATTIFKIERFDNVDAAVIISSVSKVYETEIPVLIHGPGAEVYALGL